MGGGDCGFCTHLQLWELQVASGLFRFLGGYSLCYLAVVFTCYERLRFIYLTSLAELYRTASFSLDFFSVYTYTFILLFSFPHVFINILSMYTPFHFFSLLPSVVCTWLGA